MPQQWRLYLYRRCLSGATPEELEAELGLPAQEVEIQIEAARLCFERQCLVAGNIFEAGGRM